MNKKVSAQEVVQAFAQRHGIRDLAWGSLGTAALRLPGEVEVCLEEVKTNGKLFVYLELGNLPLGEARTAFMEHMLHLNCLEQGTLCGTLAIDEATDTALLQTGLALTDLSVAGLEQAMEALLQHRSRLVASLQSHKRNDSIQKKKEVPSTRARLNRHWHTSSGESA